VKPTDLRDVEPITCSCGPGWHVRALGCRPLGTPSSDPIQRPSHYRWHPSGIECKDVVEEFPYHIGVAIAYLWRVGRKGDAIEDIEKARTHLQFEIERLARRGAS